MQVTETLNEGLKRKLELVIPASDLKSRLDAKLTEMKSKANLKGFRPGKVPMAHLKSVYGRSAMSEVMQEAINANVQTSLTDRDERAAAAPKIELSDDQAVINDVLEGGADLSVEVVYEVLPVIELMDFKSISVEKPVVPIADEELDVEVQKLFSDRREYEDKADDDKIEDGDRIGMKFVGKIDGEEFEGGSSDHAHLVVGAGQYVPGFEEQLVGLKKGASKDVKVTFPADYVNADLSGKDAVFAVEVLHISGPKDGELDEAFAKTLGMETVDALRDAVKTQMASSLESMSRQRVKRLVLDALDDGHKMDLPEELVNGEFDTIWGRVTHEIENHGKSFEDEGTTEEEARVQYREIAERRVRLGLVVAEIGNANDIQVTDEEHQQALIAEVQRYPGQEQEVYDFYRKNTQALAGLRAPVFENKVVDYVIELAEVTEKETTRNDLVKLVEVLDEADGGDHEHEHHDH